MRKTNPFFISFLAFTLSLFSCDENASEATEIANGIIDEDGIAITLEWGDEETPLGEGADLDLLISLDSSILIEGNGTSQRTETVELPFNYPDGTYELFIRAYNDLSSVEYNFRAEGSSSSLEITPWNSGIIQNDSAQFIEIKNNWFINKIGGRYEFIQ